MATLRERQKAQTRDLIIDALAEALMAGGLERATHDALAKKIGVSRQTIYRHFPDRQALLAGLWERTNKQVSMGLPTDEASLLAALPGLYEKFDQNAEVITIGQSTPQGRAMRMAVKERRSAAFLSVTEKATEGSSDEDKVLAAAVLQLLSGGAAWIEMRQQWDLTGPQMAKACGWAARTLLADLHARKGKGLAG